MGSENRKAALNFVKNRKILSFLNLKLILVEKIIIMELCKGLVSSDKYYPCVVKNGMIIVFMKNVSRLLI